MKRKIYISLIIQSYRASSQNETVVCNQTGWGPMSTFWFVNIVISIGTSKINEHSCYSSRRGAAVCQCGFWIFESTVKHSHRDHTFRYQAVPAVYTGWPNKNGTVDPVDFSGLCSDQQLSFFTLLDWVSFPHYNNTKMHQIWLKTFYFMSNFL